MNISFHKNAFEEYIFFQKNDKKIANKINALLHNMMREPFTGLGKPEPLKHNLTGFWSRRINNEHRIVYTVEKDTLYILQCKYHY
ncbi:MAG: Txe/YoeB family addiction module toxin [Rickettsiaceae bacterium]